MPQRVDGQNQSSGRWITPILDFSILYQVLKIHFVLHHQIPRDFALSRKDYIHRITYYGYPIAKILHISSSL